MQTATLHALTLRNALDTVERAASRDETRYALNSIHWENEGGALRLTATDGHRLYSALIPHAAMPLPEGGKTLPLDALPQLRKTLHKKSGGGLEATIGIGESALVVERHRAPSTEAQWIDGYPQWRNVVPSTDCEGVKIADEQRRYLAEASRCLARALEGVLPTLAPALMVEVSKDRIHLETRPAPYELSAKASVEAVTPIEGRFALNGYYLADALDALSGDIGLWFDVKHPDRCPVLLGDPRGDFAVIMPVWL